MGFDNDHLEDFDSQKGDLEAGSRAATQHTGSAEVSGEIQYEESVKRGMMTAQRERETSARTPGQFMDDIVNGYEYSVNTGRMDHMMDEDPFDTYTYDGSTITSANDITHKKFQPQQTVVHFPQHPQANDVYPPLKLAPTQGTDNTYSSSKGSDRSEKSRVKSFCCGLGRLGVVLVSLAVLAVSVAFILWLVLGYIPTKSGTTSSPSSACCKGEFEPAWSGKEICGATDVCCVVCADSIVGINANEPPGVSTSPPRPPPEKPTGSSLPCCQDQKYGDYFTRERCSREDPFNCCRVCEPEEEPGSEEQPKPDETKPEEPSSEEPKPEEPEVQTPQPSPAPSVSPTTAGPKETQAPTKAPADPPTSPPTPSPTEPPATPSPSVSPTTRPPTWPPTDPSLPCCQDQTFGDYITRKRCSQEDDPSTCCQVCPPPP